MSADNMICIQKRLDGRWWVWMDFASEDEYTPVGKERARDFATSAEAGIFASGWLHGESIVEYGINALLPQKLSPDEEKDKTLNNLWLTLSEMITCGATKKNIKTARGLINKLYALIKTEESGGSNE